MSESSTRPFTATERSQLQHLRVSPSSGGAGFAAVLTFLLVSGPLLLVLPDSWQYGLRSLAPVAVAAVAAALVFARTRSAATRGAWRQSLDRDLAEGVVAVSTWDAREALAVEEFEDEGSQYYLLLDDGRVLFLAGQYLYEAEEEGRFPCTRFTVVRAPHTGIVLEISCSGAPLAPRGQLPSFTVEDHRGGRVPEDGAVLTDVPFETLRARAR